MDKFFSGKKAEDFEHMAEKKAYIKEAYDALLKLSADDQKRLEYDAREKAIRDYEAALSYARKEGEQIGEKMAVRIISLHLKNRPRDEIAKACNVSADTVDRVVENF